jgi:hypothetical protein
MVRGTPPSGRKAPTVELLAEEPFAKGGLPQCGGKLVASSPKKTPKKTRTVGKRAITNAAKVGDEKKPLGRSIDAKREPIFSKSLR